MNLQNKRGRMSTKDSERREKGHPKGAQKSAAFHGRQRYQFPLYWKELIYRL